MRYEIHNCGPTRRIPYKVDILLVNNEVKIIEDAELAEHLAAFPQISVKKINEPIAEKKAKPVSKKKHGRHRKLQGVRK